MSAANRSNSSAALEAVLRRGTRCEADWLVGINVQHEEGLRGLRRAHSLVKAVTAHVAFTEAADAMGIDGQHPALEMARCVTHLAQSDLQRGVDARRSRCFEGRKVWAWCVSWWSVLRWWLQDWVGSDRFFF